MPPLTDRPFAVRSLIVDFFRLSRLVFFAAGLGFFGLFFVMVTSLGAMTLKADGAKRREGTLSQTIRQRHGESRNADFESAAATKSGFRV